MSTVVVPRRALLAVAVSAMIYTIEQGLTYPLLALLLEDAGAPPWEIGLNAAMTPLGMVVAGIGGPPLIRRSGARLVGFSSCGVTAACLVAIKLLEDAPLLWMPVRLLMGFALACIFVVTDTWTNELAPEHARGRVLGLYSAVLSVGFAIGPGILAVIGRHGWPPFLAGAACALLALGPLLLVRSDLPDETGGTDESGVSGWTFVGIAPLLLAGVGAVAFAEQAAMTLLPVWALGQGFGGDDAGLLLVAMTAGGVALAFPIGWLGDRVSRRLLTSGCALGAAATGGLLALVGDTPVVWPVVFAFGGTYYGIYVLCLVRLGQHFSGQHLVAGTAAFGAVWGVGGIVGPTVVGGAMSWIGPTGLPLLLVALFGALMALYAAPRLAGQR